MNPRDALDPAEARFSSNSVVVYNRFGDDLWSFKVPHSLEVTKYRGHNHEFSRFVDLNGDSIDDVVCEARYRATSEPVTDEVYFFRHDGEPLGLARAGGRVTFDGVEYTDSFGINNVVPGVPRRDGPRFYVVGFHRDEAPSFVRLVDTSGRILREYTHFGHLKVAVLWDADGDGREELVVGGMRHNPNVPVLLVFDPESFGHVPPAEGAPGAEWRRDIPEPAVFYIHLPVFGAGFEPRPTTHVSELTFGVNGGLRVTVHDGEYGMYYVFEPVMRAVDAEFTPQASGRYEAVRSDHSGMVPVHKRQEQLVDEIRYWDGDTLARKPTRVGP